MTSTFGSGDISMFLCGTLLFYNVFSNYTFFDLFFSEFYRTLSIMNTFDYFFKITNSYIVSIELYQYNFFNRKSTWVRVS